MGLSVVAAGEPSEDDGRPTEEDRLEAYYAGDDEALDALVVQYLWLERYVFGRLGCGTGARWERAQDIVQTAWLKVIDTRTNRSTRWVRGRAPLRAWLFTIVDNCICDEMRRDRTACRRRRELSDTADPSQEESLERRELHAMVLAVIGSLSLVQQQIVILKFWSDRTQAEIAVVLGLSEATVSRLLDAARSLLRIALEEEDMTPTGGVT